MKFHQLTRSFYLTTYRQFNWKFPYPKELQPSPPEKEVIDPKNIAKIDNPLSENDKFNNEYINRNPRNLEQMLLEVKPNGYPLDAPDRVFWNKLIFERSTKHIGAKVVHHTGCTVVSASTKEWAIRKHLTSNIDKTAVFNIARILAQRCLESGIYFVSKEFTDNELKTNKVQLLLKTLEENGLRTEELSAIRPKDHHYL
ncbi:39S ribosomal protein L18, mitochondrial [Caerostris darwini]|uniref:Large ribosomal subunit protein uL18m n=1 Tax=Caerostris darwini TaxID=1538125 RepID=A0AAV4R4V8_9ARAC|nr:39S ribosomal protein L18, mitochondrial [Caerostris darwini]